MKTLLEYINRRSQKSIDYSPVKLHRFSTGTPDGVEVETDRLHFIISLYEGSRMGLPNLMSFHDIQNRLANDRQLSGLELPNLDEFVTINSNFNTINRLIASVKGDRFKDSLYWSSVEKGDIAQQWNFSSQKSLLIPKYECGHVRFIKRLK